MISPRKSLALLVLMLLTFRTQGQDRIFTYAYQSNTLAAGQKELEVWTTVRSGRDAFYRAIDNRLEFEVGIAKNLQTAFYLNSSQSAQAKINVASNGVEALSIERSIGLSFSNEWKWKLTDPVANSLGSALYGEFTLAPEELEMEFKIILDKRIGAYFHAFNLVSETGFETEIESEDNSSEIEIETETSWKACYAIARNLNNHWHVGVESVLKSEKNNDPLKQLTWFAGPGCSYSKDAFWLNLTIMPQLQAFGFENGNSSTLNLASQEKLQTRVIFSYVF